MLQLHLFSQVQSKLLPAGIPDRTNQGIPPKPVFDWTLLGSARIPPHPCLFSFPYPLLFPFPLLPFPSFSDSLLKGQGRISQAGLELVM